MTLSPSSPSLVDAESVVDISPSLDKEEAPVVAPADEPRADNNAAYSSSAVKEGSVDGAPLMRILGVNYEPPGGRVSPALSNTGSIGKEDNLEWREKTEERSPTSPQRTDIHPLRLDIQPPTPPPWETAEPPDDNHMEFKREASFMNNKQPTRRLIPISSYYFGPPPLDCAYGTEPIGQIGVHHPREIVRVERDYSVGEIVQFSPTYPLELEGRITPTQFLETINAINELLISAHSLRHSLLDNALDIFSLHLSRLLISSHYDKEMSRLRQLIDDINKELYNPVGLNILWPRQVAFLFFEIEYY